jgi:hypothetical protein
MLIISKVFNQTVTLSETTKSVGGLWSLEMWNLLNIKTEFVILSAPFRFLIAQS